MVGPRDSVLTAELLGIAEAAAERQQTGGPGPRPVEVDQIQTEQQAPTLQQEQHHVVTAQADPATTAHIEDGDKQPVAEKEATEQTHAPPPPSLSKNAKRRAKAKANKAKALDDAVEELLRRQQDINKKNNKATVDDEEDNAVAVDPIDELAKGFSALPPEEQKTRAQEYLLLIDGSNTKNNDTKQPAADDAAKDPDPLNPYPAVAKGFKRQTWPEPTVPVREQFAPGTFPMGELVEHPGENNAFRVTSEEKRALERLASADQVQDLRHAAEVHRQVRMWAHTWIKPGLSLMQITDRIEAKLEQLIVKDGLRAGQAFPTGVSLNHIAAHYTPNSGDTKVFLGADDVLKIDFGTQINGRIIDCAWTWAQNPRYDPLLNAVRAATDEGLKQAGIDVRLCDIGEAVQEVMESYEIELNGKTFQVKPIRGLCGHNIEPYRIHGGKSVPSIKGTTQSVRMEEGELFAIETFGTTGKGYVVDDLDCSHYKPNPDVSVSAVLPSLRSDKARNLLKHIERTYGTLAFCRKWLDRSGHDRHLLHLNQLCDAGIVEKCPPLVDVKGCYTAQFEHTVLLKPTGKEILSRGLDY